MSKQLYPKPSSKTQGGKVTKHVADRPYHVHYTDPDNPSTPSSWGHYDSELGVKVAAWYHCRVLGFTPAATLYSRDEIIQTPEITDRVEY